jgi:hypothetical protein
LSLFIQLKFSFEVILWCSGCSSSFFRCIVTLLGYYLNFQNLSVRTNINLIYVFVLKPWFSKNSCENMGSSKLSTRLKQVKIYMIKQKIIIGVDSSWKLLRWSHWWCGYKIAVEIQVPQEFMPPSSLPALTIGAFNFPRHSTFSAFSYPLPEAWLGRGFILTFEVSSNVIHPTLINCMSFFLKAQHICMLCLATPIWYSQVRSNLYELR